MSGPNALDDRTMAAVATALAPVLGKTVRIEAAYKLSGGAIQENWRIEVSIDGVLQPLVLRRNAPSGVTISLTRGQEFALLRAAHAMGVTVPEPLALLPDPVEPGAEIALMRYVIGEARGRRLVRDPDVNGVTVVAQAGRELALIHSITPPRADLAFLKVPHYPVLPARIAELRAMLDALPDPQPVVELGLRHLELTLPAPAPLVLTHADFRTGNLIIDQDRITAVLDWEFARWGDAREDLGWFCAPCWRFGRLDREAGGLGPLADFSAAYAAGGGVADITHLRWFELMATLRWAVIALQQADRHRSGAERSLELALTAHVVPGLEQDVLDFLEAT